MPWLLRLGMRNNSQCDFSRNLQLNVISYFQHEAYFLNNDHYGGHKQTLVNSYSPIKTSYWRWMREKTSFVCLLLFYDSNCISVISRQWNDILEEKEKVQTSIFFYRIKGFLHHGMRGTGLWWRCKLYTVGKWIAAQLNVIALTKIFVPCPQDHLPHALTNWAISPPRPNQ